MPADSVMPTRLSRVNSIMESIAASIENLDEARRRQTPEEYAAKKEEANKKRKEQMRAKASEKKGAEQPAAEAPKNAVPEGLRSAAQATGRQMRRAQAGKQAALPIKNALPPEDMEKRMAAFKAKKDAANLKRKDQMRAKAQDKIAQRWSGAEGDIRAAAAKQREGERGFQVPANKAGDTDKAAKLRFGRAQAAGGPAKGDTRTGDIHGVKHSPLVKASKLMNMRLNRADGGQAWDPGAGHARHPAPEKPASPTYHHNKSTGGVVHSSGKKENKKFANNTTFRSTPDDAMLHTDNTPSGARGSAGDDEFAFHGDTKKDPRQKWYRVSKEGGYASAMASLNKIYHKDPKMRAKVIAKVRSTNFPGAQGHSIHVDPTGALHNERTACMRDKKGNLHPEGRRLQQHDPEKFYRLCKGSHNTEGGRPVSGTAQGRSEYGAGFDPKHQDSHKLFKLHRAAQAGGKAEQPHANIAQHMAARPLRRKTLKKSVRHMIKQGVKSGQAFRPQ